MWGTKVSDQNCYLVLMRAKLKAEALQNIDNICSTLRAAKQDAFQKIILTCNTQTLDFYGYFYLKTPAAIDPIEAEISWGIALSLLVRLKLGA